jgi:hypothetical protein
MRTRSLLFVALVCGLLLPADALIGAAIVGSFATAVFYSVAAATMGPIGPIATVAVFAGSTLFIDSAATAAYNKSIKDRVEEPLFWYNCSQPASFRVFSHCSTTGPRRHKTTTCSQSVIVKGHHGCNACGRDSFVANPLNDPMDLANSDRHFVCKSANALAASSNAIYTPPPVTVEHGYWDCKRLPHYKECQLCGAETAVAGYSSYVSKAGLLLNCHRENGVLDQMFVQRT